MIDILYIYILSHFCSIRDGLLSIIGFTTLIWIQTRVTTQLTPSKCVPPVLLLGFRTITQLRLAMAGRLAISPFSAAEQPRGPCLCTSSLQMEEPVLLGARQSGKHHERDFL